MSNSTVDSTSPPSLKRLDLPVQHVCILCPERFQLACEVVLVTFQDLWNSVQQSIKDEAATPKPDEEFDEGSVGL